MLYSSSIFSPVFSDWQIYGQEPSLFYSTVNHLEFSVRTSVYACECRMTVSMKACFDDNFVINDDLNRYKLLRKKKSV